MANAKIRVEKNPSKTASCGTDVWEQGKEIFFLLSFEIKLYLVTKNINVNFLLYRRPLTPFGPWCH